MINKFLDWYTGSFSNKRQSMRGDFASIVLEHIPLGNNYFYGEQSYFYASKDTYRQFISKAVEVDSNIHLQSFVLEDKSIYLGGQNLSQINTGQLIYREHCDLIFKYDMTLGYFVGSTVGTNCRIEKNNNTTYIRTKAILKETNYDIEDRGFDVVTNKQVWGSSGMYNFDKLNI